VNKTAIKVVKRERSSLFLLIFSIAIYVREAGIAGTADVGELSEYLQPMSGRRLRSPSPKSV